MDFNQRLLPCEGSVLYVYGIYVPISEAFARNRSDFFIYSIYGQFLFKRIQTPLVSLHAQLIDKQKIINMKNMATKTNSKTKPVVRYIVDADGKRSEVVLPIVLYERLLEELEELEDIRDFDEAMNDHDFLPWEEVKKQLGV